MSHHYEPDYLVRLADGPTLIFEVKGYEDDETQQKHQAAQRWVSAVNHWGKLSRWDFLVSRDVQILRQALRGLVTAA